MASKVIELAEGPTAEKTGRAVDGVVDTAGGAWTAGGMGAETGAVTAPDAIAELGPAVAAGLDASSISLKDGRSDMIVG
jgi:hypothetical protein